MNRARASELLQHKDIHPAVLDYVLTESYPDWVLQEPETTLVLLRSLLGAGEPSAVVRTKANALKVAHKTEGPWNDWETFQWVSQAFNDNLADFDNAYRPALGELYIGIDTLKGIRSEMDFSDEVRRWMAACGLDLGIVWSPPPMDFVNDLLDVREYRCVRCGNVDLDRDNEKCDTCGAPESSLVKTHKYMDPSTVENSWKGIQHEPLEELRLVETPIGIHLAKLAAATIMAGDRRTQRRNEMKYVKG